MATSSAHDPFKEILEKKRAEDAKKGEYQPSPAALEFLDKMGVSASSQPAAAEKPAPKKSFLDNAAETASDLGVSGADGATYGYLSKVLPYVMPGEVDGDKEKQIKDRLALAEERSPIASSVGQIGGFAASPITKLLGGLGAGGKLAAWLGDAGKVASSPSLRALAKALNFALPAVEGSAMVAAHEGDHTPAEIAAGGAANLALGKLPKVATGALVGSTIADKAGDKYAPQYGNKPAMVGALLGALTGKGGSMALNAANKKRDPVLLKQPLETLEAKYESIGKNVPSQMRGPNRSYAVPDWELQSDKVRDIRKGIDDLQVQEMAELPEASRKAYSQAADILGNTRFETASEALANPESKAKVLMAIKALNDANGVTQDPEKTLVNMLVQRKANKGDLGYDPGNDSLSDIIIGKIRQTPIRQLRAFNNVFKETRNMPELNPDAIPNDVLDAYGRNLALEGDVDSGRLNKWLRETSKAGQETPSYARLYDPENPSQLLDNETAQRMMDEGRKVVLSPPKKPQSTRQDISDPVMTDLASLVSENPPPLPRKSSGNKKSGEPEILNPNEAKIAALQKVLYDMREGRRQLSLSRNEPQPISMVIKDALERYLPLRTNEVRQMYDLLPIKNFEKMDKNLKYYGNNYGKGKYYESMPASKRPQILRLKELSERDDAVGTAARHLLDQIESGNAGDLVKSLYLGDKNNEARKYFQ